MNKHVPPPPSAPEATTADSITILTSLESPLAKTIVPDGETTRVQQDVTWYRGEEATVYDIHSLAAVLEAASVDPCRCVVRGEIIEGTDVTRMRRLKLEQDDGTKPTLREVPHHWLLLDIEGIEAPAVFDQFENAEATVAFVKKELPPEFLHATCWYQFTNSAGVKPGIRLRLGFWLDRALSNADLKRWLGQYKIIDKALFSAAQVHYIAAPIIAPGGIDPARDRPRSGTIAGKAEAANVPADLEQIIKNSGASDRGTTESHREAPETAVSGAPRGLGLSTLIDFNDHLAAIGDHAGGYGCHMALKATISAYWREYGSAASPEGLLALLEKRINQAKWNPAHGPEYLQKQIKDLPGLIKTIQGLQRETEAANGFESINTGVGVGTKEDANEDAKQDEIVSPLFSDDNLALRLAKAHANSLRYVSKLGRWLLWNDKQWHFDETLIARKHARTICRKAAKECNQPKQQKLIASAKTISAVERLAQADPLIAATVDQWDADPWLLNTPAETINLQTGERKAHEPGDYLTKITGVRAEARPTPVWNAFLARVTADNPELMAFLQRMAGYSLTGSTREHALFFLYGMGANGKTTFLNAITEAAGEYHKTAPIETFTASNTDRHPTDLAGLRGARLVTAVETEEGRRWAESKIKSLTGGDKISARFMRQDFFEYTPQFKLVIAGNHKPGLRSVDEAMKRRLNLIPFTVTIPPEQRDEQLADKLRAELPGILDWMVKGCAAWLDRGLAPPKIVTEATAAYLEAEDAVASWMEEVGERDPNGVESSNDLWLSWSSWANTAGEYVGSQKRFTVHADGCDNASPYQNPRPRSAASSRTAKAVLATAIA
jgi:putative DNA primase/helicase